MNFNFSENEVTVSTSMQNQISHPGRVSGKLDEKNTNCETQSRGSWSKSAIWFLKPISVWKDFEVVPTF